MADPIKPVYLGDRFAPPAPRRLAGALKATTALGNNASAKERLLVAGFKSVTLRVKLSAAAGTPKLDLLAVLADATDGDDSSGTQATTGNPVQVSLAAGTEATITYTLNGERYLDAKISCGAADTATVAYVDVFAEPL